MLKNKFDIKLFITIVITCIYGIIMIYSASSIWAEYKFNDKFHYVIMQSIFFIIGLFLMILVSKIDCTCCDITGCASFRDCPKAISEWLDAEAKEKNEDRC